MSCNMSSMWCRMSHDHNWANGSSLSLTVGWWVIISHAWMLSLRPQCWAEISDFIELWKMPQLASGNSCFQLLHREQQQEVMEEILSAEEEKKLGESLTSNEIRKMCKMWETVKNFVEKHHPNKTVAVWVMNLFNDNAISLFNEIFKRRRSKCHWIASKAAWKVKDSIEPIGTSDSVSDSESCPTQ